MRRLTVTGRLAACLATACVLAAVAAEPIIAAAPPAAVVGDPLSLVPAELPVDLETAAELVPFPLLTGAEDDGGGPMTSPAPTVAPVTRDAEPRAQRPDRTPTSMLDQAIQEGDSPRPATSEGAATTEQRARSARGGAVRAAGPSPDRRRTAGRALAVLDMPLGPGRGSASEKAGAEQPRRGPISDVVTLIPESVKVALVLMSMALVVLLAAVSGSRRQLEAALARAHSDTLTGLPNRAAIDEALERMTAQAARTRRPLGFVMLDIDHFKSINDTYGHATGDEVLAAVGAVARAAVRAGDFVGRYGGEELLVLMPETDAAGAQSVAEKLQREIRAIEVPAVDRVITASFGVAADRGSQERLRRLVQAADEALYRAKADGRDAIEVASRDRSAALVA